MAKPAGWTIAIRPTVGSRARKITKIMPLADGGFSVLTPYHRSKSGHLFKMPLDPGKLGRYLVATEECVNFSVNDKVKLSYHVDGFAQFSSENQGTIISGIDPVTKLPKGIGLYTHPLSHPIFSGGSVGISIWGIDHFDQVIKENSRIVVFEPEEFYFRACDTETANSWHLSVYVFPKTSVPAVKIRNGRKYFQVNTERLNGSIYCMVEMQLLELGENSPVNLAIYGNRVATSFEAESGWMINGPGDYSAEKKGHVLMARYPLNPTEKLEATSLDRSAP